MLSGLMGSIFGGKAKPLAPDPALIRQRRALEATAAREKAKEDRRRGTERDARRRGLGGRRSLICGTERGFEIAPVGGFLSSVSDLGS